VTAGTDGAAVGPGQDAVVHLDEGLTFWVSASSATSRKAAPGHTSTATRRANRCKPCGASSRRRPNGSPPARRPAFQASESNGPRLGPVLSAQAAARPMPPSATICGGGSGPGCCINIPAPVNALLGSIPLAAMADYNGVRLYNPTTMRIQRYRYRAQDPHTMGTHQRVPA